MSETKKVKAKDIHINLVETLILRLIIIYFLFFNEVMIYNECIATKHVERKFENFRIIVCVCI